MILSDIKHYTIKDYKYQRGYVSRKDYNAQTQTLYTAGGRRKGDLYYLAPAYKTSQYCIRVYIDIK